MEQNTTSGMAKWFTWPVIIIIVLVLVVGYGISAYNSFVRANVGIDTAWAQVESQYQRRYDLVPNLVNSVKGIMTQEQEVFTAIADARTKYAGAATPETKAAAASQMEGSLARLLVVMENYPQLRSVETVQSLMAELAGTENRIATERMRYNDTVKSYNIKVQTLPGSLLSGMFGFAPRTMFEAATGAETAPTVTL